MFLSQPSVSLQVKALESEMDTILFERRGPRIDLTPDGQLLYELASPLVERLDALPAAFAERRGTVDSGELSIAAGESTILYILPKFMTDFAKRHPGVRLKLQNVTGRDGLNKLRADEVDIAVGAMPDVPDDILYCPIFNYDPMLITPPDHPLANRPDVTLAEISKYGLILPPRQLSTWGVVDLVFRQHDLEYSVILEAGGWEVVKKYVELGLGISIVSGVCITGREPLWVTSLSAFFPQRTYGVVLRRGKFLSPAARRFIETMDPGFFAELDPPEEGQSL